MRPVNFLRSAALIVTVAIAAASGSALADQNVEMLNKHPETTESNVFYPPIVKVQPGETVTWQATNKGHNVEFINGSIPDGATLFRSKLNQDASFTFEQPGVYVYKCSPHYGLGMVGIVVVGDAPANLSDVAGKKYPGKAGKRLSALFDEIGG